MEYQQAPAATSFSKKLVNGGGLTGKHVYDGVFAGPAKPGSRMEDYREIFGASATCSIPILDFPELNERNISIEARALKPDYSMIFGGCEEPDFAVSFEEMISKPKRVKSRAQEARVPTEAKCRTSGPKPYNSAEEKSAPSPEVSSKSFDDVKQFNLSYNKSNAGSGIGTVGTTHIAQLHVVPGYTRLIDEQTTRQVSDGGKAAQTPLNEARLNANASEVIKERNPPLRAVSGPQPQEPSNNSSTNNAEIPKKPRRHWSFANDVSFDFEIGLGTQPSTPPSNIGSDVGSIKSKFGAFRSDDKERADGSYSPPLLDEEMDANSAAAASAAAVRKAIEEAQAKIRIAKELMERKKQGLQNHVKPSFTNGLRSKRKETKAAEKINRSSEKAEEMHLKETVKQALNRSTEHDSEKSSQATLYFRNTKEPSFVRASFGESNSTQVVREAAFDVNQEINAEKTRPATLCKEKTFGVEDNKKPVDGEKILEVSEDNLNQENVHREINSAEVTFRWDIYRHNIKSAEELHQLEENEDAVRIVNDNAEAACGPDMTYLPEEDKNEGTFEPEEDAESVICDLVINRNEVRNAVDEVENEMRQREVERQEEMEIQLNEALREENDDGLDEIQKCERNGRGQKEEFDRTQRECCYQEENDKSRISDPKPMGTRKRFQVHREEVIGAIRNSFRDEEDRQGEDHGTESDEDLVDSTESEIIFQEDYQENSIGKQTTYEDAESEMIQTEIHLEADNKNNIEGKVEGADDAMLENERVIEGFSYPKEAGGESKVVEEADDWVEKENVETGDMEHGPVVPDRSNNQTADLHLGETGLMFDHQQFKYQMTEYENGNLGFHFEEVTSQSDENEKDASDSLTSISGQGSESNFVSSSDDRIDSHMPCTSEKQVDEAVCGSGESDQDTKENQVCINLEEVNTCFESSFEQEWVDSHVNVQASKQSQEEQEEKKVQESIDGRTNQNIDKDENCQKTETAENRDSEDNLKKEVEFANKHRERKEEIRTREMEKEKERMAVERAIREVRERAYAEARERAAAKRTAAEAREKSEKVSSETNSKSATEKASMEAKLRAQRAAVERATAEARERALEKALSEKAKSSDQQSKGSGHSKSSGTDTELPERCKATFERNQRTAERAAKALAEKNMRDLLAQKEQAERNRLAEILDAEVKRWASGKERNLRALLSTLQYILGSDSGWQPVPLTDLISTAAVKKAYRKATLFVHPDKLQQRGANIQQKYTCEKVFDLLKDGWNKFSAEER